MVVGKGGTGGRRLRYSIYLSSVFEQTHIDIIQDFDSDLVTQLQALSKEHDFLIFEDRKFADIGESEIRKRWLWNAESRAEGEQEGLMRSNLNL